MLTIDHLDRLHALNSMQLWNRLVEEASSYSLFSILPLAASQIELRILKFKSIRTSKEYNIKTSKSPEFQKYELLK